jgi:hypothetical protein
MSGPTLEVRNVTQQKHKNAQQSVKYSGFHITVSTNKRPKTNEESHALGGRLNEAIATTCTHTGLTQFISFLKEGHTYKSNIKDIDVQYAIELGTQKAGGRIHSHIVLKVTHTSMIRINIPVLKQLLLTAINKPGVEPVITSLYVNVGMIRSDKNLEEYLLKKQVEVKDIGKEKIDSGDARVDAEALARDVRNININT